MSNLTSPVESTRVERGVESTNEGSMPLGDISPIMSSPISPLLRFQLSEEMLKRILTTRLPDDGTPEGLRVLRLALVCKRWRQFMLEQPHLWRYPLFRVNECAEVMIERAGPHPLFIDLSLSSSYIPDQSAGVRTAFAHLYRAETLSITMNIGQQRDYEVKRVESLLQFLQAPGPILKSFALVASRSTPSTLIPDTIFQTQSGNLQQVRLINWNLSWALQLPPAFLCLTDLAVILDSSVRTGYSVPRSTIRHVLHALRALHNLRSLELRDVFISPVPTGDITWSKEGTAPPWTNLKKFRLADRFKAANIVFNCVAYPASAEVTVIGLPNSESNNGFQDALGLFRKLAARAGGRIQVLKIAQGPPGDHSFSGWSNPDQVPLADLLENIPPRVKLEGPLTVADIFPCLKRTPVDYVEHAIVARAPIGEYNWERFGCLDCLKSIRVTGDDLDLLKVLRRMPPRDPNSSETTASATQEKVPFAKLDSLHLEDWRFGLAASYLTSADPIQAPTSLRTNFDDLDTIIRTRVDRGYGPKRLTINPTKGPFEGRVRNLMDFCEMSSCFDWEKLEVRE